MLIRIFETILIMLNILKSVNNSYCKKYYTGVELGSLAFRAILAAGC